jgi:hypothetical protein
VKQTEAILVVVRIVSFLVIFIILVRDCDKLSWRPDADKTHPYLPAPPKPMMVSARCAVCCVLMLWLCLQASP